jgi:hypothetical protein
MRGHSLIVPVRPQSGGHGRSGRDPVRCSPEKRETRDKRRERRERRDKRRERRDKRDKRRERRDKRDKRRERRERRVGVAATRCAAVPAANTLWAHRRL